MYQNAPSWATGETQTWPRCAGRSAASSNGTSFYVGRMRSVVWVKESKRFRHVNFHTYTCKPNPQTHPKLHRWFSKFFVFPEGAIFRQSMVEKSHDFARKQGLPLLNVRMCVMHVSFSLQTVSIHPPHIPRIHTQHCLLPKTGAFLLCGRLLRQQVVQKPIENKHAKHFD